MSANQAWLEAELEWVRALLRRRSLWLRSLWRRDRDEDWQRLSISDAEADLALDGALTLRRERAFYREDPAAAAMTESIAALRNAADELRRNSPLARIARLFGLSGFEEHALVWCLAPEVEPWVSPLYAYTQDDARLRFPTAHLLLALSAEEGTLDDCRSSLGPRGTLLRYRLLERVDAEAPGAPLAARPLLVAARIAGCLMEIGRAHV